MPGCRGQSVGADLGVIGRRSCDSLIVAGTVPVPSARIRGVVTAQGTVPTTIETGPTLLEDSEFEEMAKKYWLFKTEPQSYSIQDLAGEPKKTTHWDGVRNYQARNLLRDEIKTGDAVLIYHSNANPPAIAGTAVVVRQGYPDHTAWDKNDKHFDPKSTPENPRWFMVDVKLTEVFKKPITLPELREIKQLSAMELLRKGSRLSIQPVSKMEYDVILKRARA